MTTPTPTTDSPRRGPTPPDAPPADRRRRRAGFTLIELMVSVAMVLVLILGVTQVFKITSDTIGASTSLSEAIRGGRGTSSVMFDDLRHAVLPGSGAARGAPFFIIRSERVAAFPGPEVAIGDLDYNPALETRRPSRDVQESTDLSILTADRNADNVEDAAEASHYAALDDRNHRVDQLYFFARDNYRRQTGNDGTYAAAMTSNEAMIWFGHLKQPGDLLRLNQTRSPGYTPTRIENPAGTDTYLLNARNNPYNFYSRQWALGRQQILLIEPEAVPTAPVTWSIFLRDANGVVGPAQYYIGRSRDLRAGGNPQHNNNPENWGPLQEQSNATLNGRSFAAPPGSVTFQIQHSRYDLAGTSMENFRENILERAIAEREANVSPAWWTVMVDRFSGYPVPSKPMTSEGAARTVPVLQAACSQFVVEYAGDFVTQTRETDNPPNGIDANDRTRLAYGDITAAEPDGVIDFLLVRQAGQAPIERIRWYGFPRNVDTSDDGADPVIRGIPTDGVNGDFNTMRDVVPLRDYIMNLPAATPNSYDPQYGAPFERQLNNNPWPGGPTRAANTLERQADYGAAGAMEFDSTYLCAWQPAGTYRHFTGASPAAVQQINDPPMPRMIRLVVGIDDTNGRLTADQIYEYVVELP